uniref:Uncharacterized protein n=1 Tax=Ciona savignyi TaxID=51511 RepID=H2Y663_CIOSA
MFVAVNRIRCKASVLFRGYKQQMATEDVKYNEAVQTLNEMQCNRMLTSQQKMNGMGLVVMRELLHRINISNDDLNQLKIIHITGTKGKGSTCAFVDNILRKHGVKTGFYSSPHLLEVRERIRVNGRPISTDLFTQYFWEVFDLLKLTEHNYEVKVPSYFYMLTALALYVFKHEHVSATILEVGIGGAYDCTNVVPNPVCCGVASLGLDHTDLLGNTLGEIAWQKGGIFKRGATAFTVPQPDEGMKVLHQRADEVGADLKVAPPLESYPMGKGLPLGLSGDHQM